MTQELITSRKNPLLQQVRQLFHSRAARQASGLFACDGTKLLDEALLHGYPVETVILTQGLEFGPVPAGIRLVRVPEDVMESLSPMQAPQGAVFLCRRSPVPALDLRPGTLILDGIQDPGNLGTMLRTANAMGVPVVLDEGCADPYGWKAARATMGAIFRQQPMEAGWETIVEQCARRGIPLVGTALTDRARDLRELEPAKCAVVIGSEGRGIRPALLERCDQTAIIPMTPGCESLNAAAAAAIVLWEMGKTRL